MTEASERRIRETSGATPARLVGEEELLAEIAWPPSERPLVYVVGPTGFVEVAAGALVALGHDPGRIRDRTLLTDRRPTL